MDFEGQAITWNADDIEAQIEQKREGLRNQLAQHCNYQHGLIQAQRNVFMPTKAQGEQSLDSQEQDLMPFHDSFNSKIDAVNTLHDAYILEREMMEKTSES